MAEIENWKKLEAWLKKQPCQVAVALAARAALRVAPAVHGAMGANDYAREFVLPVFRATGVAWSAAKYPDQATRLVAAANDAAYIAKIVFDGYIVGCAPDAAAYTADAAGDAAYAAYTAYAAGDAAYAYTAGPRAAAYTAAEAAARAAAAAEAAADAAAFWSAVSTDATRVEEGAAASDIAGSRLWPNGQPKQLQSLWQEMKAALPTENQDWEVWTDWYDARLQGKPSNKKLEIARATIPDEIWDQGPAAVNAEIKRLIEEH